eukprot:CAMPEP_0194275162 /NCGR_PEP_ID=MMETSP0169-20130528/8072_1 /TAXON_ID=218684 /ORGANISM="Corethron pennatum, Strain L29A3" /LENGTH=348 /DNA_ID=CAMNT_0039018559 /DNA_START=116 /DNA_END=1162 /DNA_ORIENTATION=-
MLLVITQTPFRGRAEVGDTVYIVAAFAPSQALRHRTYLPKQFSVPASRAHDGGVPPENSTVRRRKKKNKYEKFSKVNSSGPDPFEQMLAEAERKKSLPSPPPDDTAMFSAFERVASPRQEFPDAAEVDPLDPTTFGFVELGVIVGPHGVKGEVRVRPSTDFTTERLCNPGQRHIKAAGRRAPRPTLLERGRAGGSGGTYLVKLGGVDDRQAATLVKGAVLYGRRDVSVPRLGTDEYRIDDLAYMNVYRVVSESEPDRLVGRVAGIVLASEFSDAPAGIGNDLVDILLPLRDKGGGEVHVLVPFVPQIVPVVDVEARRMVLDPPEGLLDITYVREEKVVVRGLLAPGSD